MSHESPPILRPVPRRPFDLSLTTPTPPSDASGANTPLNGHPSNAALAASNGAATPSDISRTRSILNLTSSTLFGIYSPTYSEKADERPSTPFGTLSPLDTKARPQIRRKGSQTPRNSVPLRLVGYLLRTALLFGLGTAYGLLVTHLHNEHRLAPLAAKRGGIIEPSYETRYLMFWGISGVLMGSALPWIDDLWEEYFGEDVEVKNGKAFRAGDGTSDSENEDEGVAAQWTPVVRSAGAFVGIAFAIRKLPWTSTLQVSLTLALVNPFLWYLLDRSKPGFLLSVIVGAVGTTGLMALDSSLVPNPLGAKMPVQAAGNGTVAGGSGMLSKAYREGKVDSVIWIMSVLFCSVLCFGHIGRRLALLRRRARAKQA